jgi:hypothetical protein
VKLASFPEVTVTTSQVGRPDDGTDTTGFFNTEYFVDLKPKERWRSVFHQNKDELIGAMNRELEKMPGVIWNFSQPIADNMEEAVSGVKGQLATKIYGDDLEVLEDKGAQVVDVMRQVRGIEDLGLFRVRGQPNLNFTVDRKQAARYQINVADVQDAVETAVGGNALTQVLRGEQRFDLVMRYLPQYRDTREAIADIRLLAPSNERVSLAQLCKIDTRDGASEIYREGNSRYVAIKYSVRGRDLGGAVEEAIKKVDEQVKLPNGYTIGWEGEYQSEKRSERRLLIIVPITVLIIFIILYTMFHSFKWFAHSGECGYGTHRRTAGAIGDAHQLQRVVWSRLLGAVRSVRANGRDHAGVHESASCPRQDHRRLRDRGSGSQASPHHDDDAGSDAGSVAGRAFARHRLRFPASVRHRDRGRVDCGPGHEHLPSAHTLCLGRRRPRRTARGGIGCGGLKTGLSDSGPGCSCTPAGRYSRSHA